MPRQPGSNPPRRTTRSLYERNYGRLEDIIGRPLPDLESGVVYRLRAEGFMDLVVEVLSPCPVTGAPVLSLCHYFLQNGDLCQDPEMEARVFPPREGHPGRVEALTFQQALTRRSTAGCTRSRGWSRRGSIASSTTSSGSGCGT